MEINTVEELIKDELISPKAKLEVFLAVALKLRPAGQIAIPAELPHGVEMGQQIDRNVQSQMMQLKNIQDIVARAKAIKAIKDNLEKNFEKIVEDSSEYKALYNWSKRMFLKSNQIKVRPTLHEIYFYNDRDTGRNLHKLMNEREKIRRKVQRKPTKSLNNIRFAFPEEFEPKWLHGLGKVLGYPECCVKQYADDRINGINVETRASQQLIEAINEKKVDTHVYFTGYFFPCNPRCENAKKKGYDWHETLNELNEELGELYEHNIQINTELVLRQPELIQKYLSQFKPRNVTRDSDKVGDNPPVQP